MLLSEAIAAFDRSRAGVVAESTRRWYGSRLGALLGFLGDVEVGSISIRDLRGWRAALAKQPTRWQGHPRRRETLGPLSPYTLHAYLRAARTFFRWLEEDGYVDQSPARRLKLPTLPNEVKKDISQEDALRIIEAARGNVRDYAMLRFLADTGCRLGGLASLTLDRLNLEPDAGGFYRAVVREKGHGGGKFRVVYFGQGTAEALAAYLEVRPDVDEDRVFLKQQPGRPVAPLAGEGVYRVIERYAKRAGVTGRWNPHAWRHAYAHGLIDGNVHLAEVSQLMGHSSIVVTVQFYGQRADERLAEAHARGSWLNSKARD